ncbi:MAG: hypothetical protein Q9Q13_10765 [Acidobacteriota bacterium]|nr:hypothetical protein [Acidobacteriota bacterium]
MRYAIICQSRSHADLLRESLGARSEETAFAVEAVALERALKRDGCEVVRGRFRDRALYRALLPADLLLISLKDRRRFRTVLEAVRRERGDTPVLVLPSGPSISSL